MASEQQAPAGDKDAGKSKAQLKAERRARQVIFLKFIKIDIIIFKNFFNSNFIFNKIPMQMVAYNRDLALNAQKLKFWPLGLQSLDLSNCNKVCDYF